MKPVAERFWAKVDRGDATECWLWRGCITHKGYGLFRINNPDNLRAHAHRVAYTLEVGPIPDGLQIDHLCRVRHCVNPAHLEPVTARENTRRGLVSRGVLA